MTPEQRQAEARRIIQQIDWHTYDYTMAPGADMSFPDFPQGPNNRPVWISKHYNQVPNMATCHVTDLNNYERGFERRLYALYGVPVEWSVEDNEAELKERLHNLDRAKATSPERFAEWLAYYGLVNEEHMEWMRERVTGEVGSVTKAMAQDMLNKQGEAQKQKMADQIQEMRQEGGELNPFMGVSLEVWAQAQAQISSGADAAQVVASMGLDQGTWQAVSAEWNARMSRDTTLTISTVYGQAFASAGQGQFGASGQAAAAAMNPGGAVDISSAPCTMERWIEVTVAQGAAEQNGQDPNALLAQFGLTAADWGMMGMWWGQYFNAHAMEMMDDYNRLTAQFEAKYGVGHADGMTSDEREEATVAELINMVRGGQVAQVLGYLQQKFPEDASDNDALDWWLDKVCDKFGETGERACAQQLLQVRYPLQEDEDEPMGEWIQGQMEDLFD